MPTFGHTVGLLAWYKSKQSQPPQANSGFPNRLVQNGETLYTLEQEYVMQVLACTLSAFSVASALLAFYWFRRMRRGFRHDLIMFLIQSDMFKALWFMIFPIAVFIKGEVVQNSTFCKINGFFLSLAIEASDIAILMIAIHSALYIFKPGTSSKEAGLYPYRKIAFAAWVILPLLSASLAFINKENPYVTQSTYCYLPVRPFWARLVLAWVPRYLIFLIILIIYVMIYIHVRRTFDDSKFLISPGDLEIRQDASVYSAQQLQSSALPTVPSLALNPNSAHSSVTSRDSACLFENQDSKQTSTAATSPSTERVLSDAFEFGFLTSMPNGQTGSTNEALKNHRAKIEKQMRFLFIYPLVYIGMWILPFIGHVMQYSETYAKSMPFPLAAIINIFVTCQCAVDCWLFSTRERPWEHIPGSKGGFWESFAFWRGPVFKDIVAFLGKVSGARGDAVIRTRNASSTKDRGIIAAYDRRDTEREEKQRQNTARTTTELSNPGRTWWDLEMQRADDMSAVDEEDDPTEEAGPEATGLESSVTATTTNNHVQVPSPVFLSYQE